MRSSKRVVTSSLTSIRNSPVIASQSRRSLHLLGPTAMAAFFEHGRVHGPTYLDTTRRLRSTTSCATTSPLSMRDTTGVVGTSFRRSLYPQRYIERLGGAAALRAGCDGLNVNRCAAPQAADRYTHYESPRSEFTGEHVAPAESERPVPRGVEFFILNS